MGRVDGAWVIGMIQYTAFCSAIVYGKYMFVLWAMTPTRMDVVRNLTRVDVVK